MVIHKLYKNYDARPIMNKIYAAKQKSPIINMKLRRLLLFDHLANISNENPGKSIILYHTVLNSDMYIFVLINTSIIEYWTQSIYDGYR